MNHTLRESIKLAKKKKVKAPRSLKIYMDDTFGILKKKKNDSYIEFLNTLNEIDSNVKLTFGTEADNTLPFLYTLIKEKNGTLQTMVYRKKSNTGLTINPFSNQNLTSARQE